jgi:protein SCO1/2
MITVLILGITAAIVISVAESSRASIPVLGHVPDFEFTERSGVPFGSKDLLGEIWVVDFIFTNCPGPCPFMSSVMSDLYEYYGSAEKLRFVSISVDPWRDTLEALQQYAERFGARDNRWVFLRAEMDQVQWLYRDVFMLSGDLPGEHSTRFILVDDKCQIRGYYLPEDDAAITLLKRHIEQLARGL